MDAPADIQRSNLVVSDALDRTATLGLLGLLGGGGLRLVQGLPDLLGRRKVRPDPSTEDIPVPVPKLAAGYNRLGDLLGLYQDPAGGSQGPHPWVEGRQAQSPSGVPWFLPAAGLAAVGGGLGGYHLVDSILKRKQKGDLDDDVEEARGDFQNALTEGYRPPHKYAAAGPHLAADLDELADLCGLPRDGKTAGGPLDSLADAATPYVPDASLSGARDAARHYGGALTGVYGTGLLAALAAGGYLGYDAAKKKNQDALVDRAVAETTADRMATTPPEVYPARTV